MDRLLERAWRQRRRIALVALLSGLAWMVATGGGDPLFLLGVMAASAVASALWIGIMPAGRGMASGFALGFLLTAIVDATLLGLGTSGFYVMAIILGLVLGLFRSLIMVSLPLGKLTQAVSGRAAVAMPPAEALELLVNDEGAGDEPKWHPEVDRIERDQSEPTRVRLYMKSVAGEEAGIADVTILEHVPGKRYRASVRNVGAGKDIDGGAVTHATFEAAPHPRGALITISEENTLPAALILAMWIDDAPGDYAARFAAIVEDRPDHSFFTADHRFIEFWARLLPAPE
ncbi:MAG: hypothetical protein AAF371_19775 [Pseudomonadota bacterium]